MYDYAFDARGLERELRPADFQTEPRLRDEIYKANVLTRATAVATQGHGNIALARGNLRNRPVYQVSLIEHALVLRKLSRNIRHIARVRQSDRNTIIKSLRAALSSGYSLRVYKLDIRDFYEATNRDHIDRLLSADRGMPPASIAAFRWFSTSLAAQGIQGLPRGVAISATLSEYVMRQFDAAIRNHESVHYYARFVDDMIVVTTGTENRNRFIRQVRNLLPIGHELNYHKTQCIELNAPLQNNVANFVLDGTIDFLGYQFQVSSVAKNNRGRLRTVRIDISPRKVARFKTRMVLASLEYLRTGDFDDLYDRMRIISGNYNLYDYSRHIRRNVGIFYNYRFVDEGNSVQLAALDKFLHSLFSATSGRIAPQLRTRLTRSNREALLGLSFRRSFNRRTFTHVKGDRLAELVRCWAYE